MCAKTRLLVAIVATLSMSAAIADGAGTGVNSWIGYVFGGNQVTGTGSAVAAGADIIGREAGAAVGTGYVDRADEGCPSPSAALQVTSED